REQYWGVYRALLEAIRNVSYAGDRVVGFNKEFFVSNHVIDKSSSTAPTVYFSSSLSLTSDTSLLIACMVEWLRLKPNWYSDISLFFVMCANRALLIRDSNILLRLAVRLIGR
ncbi:hypothetical protein PV326_009561, partial [Microctonus aethiopoides]